MPAYCQRTAAIEAIRRSSVHRSIATPSSDAAMERAKHSILSDPYESLDLLRKLIQEDINKKVNSVMQEFVKDYFGPAVENMKQNLLGTQSQNSLENSTYCSHHWLENVCCDALEHAKLAFRNVNTFKKISIANNNNGEVHDKIHSESIINNETGHILNESRPLKRKFDPSLGDMKLSEEDGNTSTPVDYTAPLKRRNNKKHNNTGCSQSTTSASGKAAVSNSIDNAGDTILITKQGKPVRREGFKWNPERLKSKETLFVLGSRANKALGLGGPGRARLYTKHPDLFKYSIKDREDKEWLGKQSGLVPIGSSVGGKACYVMVLQDILELAATDEYSSHPRRKHGELVDAGFHAPSFMVEKMKTLMKQIATDPEISDEQLLVNAASKIQRTSNHELRNSTSDKGHVEANGSRNSQIQSNSNVDGNALAANNSIFSHDKEREKTEKRNDMDKYQANSSARDRAQDESSQVEMLPDMKLEDEGTSQDGQEHDSLVDSGSVEEDDLGSLLHGVNLNSLVREFEMEAACVAAAAAEGVDEDCNEIVSGVGDNVSDSEVSNLGGFLALAGECDQAASNSSEVSNTE